MLGNIVIRFVYFMNVLHDHFNDHPTQHSTLPITLFNGYSEFNVQPIAITVAGGSSPAEGHVSHSQYRSYECLMRCERY